MGADEDVLRVAGDRAGGADVGGGGQADQVRHGVVAQPPGQVQHQRRQGHAHHVVDEEGRQAARQHDDGGQQAQRTADAGQGEIGQPLEEARQPQHADHDHHAKQQEQRVEVEGRRQGFLGEGKQAGDEHGRGTDQGDARAVHAQPRNPSQGQAGVGEREKGRRQPERRGAGHELVALVGFRALRPRKAPLIRAATDFRYEPRPLRSRGRFKHLLRSLTVAGKVQTPSPLPYGRGEGSNTFSAPLRSRLALPLHCAPNRLPIHPEISPSAAGAKVSSILAYSDGAPVSHV